MASRRRLDADTVEIVTKDAATAALEVTVTGETFPRLRVTGDGVIKTGAGSADPATTLGSSNTAGTAGAVRTIGPFTINYDDAGIEDGVELFTPQVHDVIHDVLIVTTAQFNGTTPLLDVGDFDGETAGLFSQIDGPVNLASAVYAHGGIVLQTSAVATLAGIAAYQGGYGGFRVETANPFKAVISQDGTAGGTAVGGTAGSVDIYVVISTPTDSY